jgi:integrase/recombinase XerD
MYGTGLRIGEVLGLTVEDIEKYDTEDSYKLILRNRLSDKKYQLAKGCISVKNKSTYSSSEYKTKNKGYEELIIVGNIKILLDEYISMSTNVFNTSEKVISNIAKFATADNVTFKNLNNRYIFLNKNGTPLSSSGWNKFLKTVFNAVGIPIDKYSKTENLNHRFRHGYAMLLKQNGYSLDDIKHKMRHNNISSTQIYARNTEKDILENAKKIDTLRYINKEKEDL